MQTPIRSTRTLSRGTVSIKQTDTELQISLPPAQRSSIATVVEVTVKGPALAIKPMAVNEQP